VQSCHLLPQDTGGPAMDRSSCPTAAPAARATRRTWGITWDTHRRWISKGNAGFESQLGEFLAVHRGSGSIERWRRLLCSGAARAGEQGAGARAARAPGRSAFMGMRARQQPPQAAALCGPRWAPRGPAATERVGSSLGLCPIR
jgi:hypothetical protein